ncbi:MAG: IS110 family transposase [Lachnospiraceae bacterium]|nr:IS110 family transposase [Lachnospiraceae bacterium]
MISVGIDVSKGESTVCIMKPGGEVLRPPFKMLHSIEDILHLVDLIKSYDEETRVVLEDTGHYHLPVVTLLVEKGIFVCTVNALRMKKYCSQSIRRAKTDKIDSVRIASYGLTYWNELTPVMPPDTVYKELKMLARQYYQMISMLIKAKVNLSNLLDQVMPQIQSLMTDSKSNHKLTDFVSRYWHYGHILDMGEKRFTTDYCKWAKKQGYRVYERLAKEIFALAQNGIPVLPNSISTKIAVKEAVRVIHEIEISRDTILTQMQELAKSLPEYSVVREMSCIGDVLAPRIIAEVGDVRHFYSKHSLIAYAGIDAPPYQSGCFNAIERHISKRGNSYLRKTGYEIMQSLIQHKPVGDPVYDFIQKKRSEGKSGKEAMIAGLNKFLRIYYGKVTELYRNISDELVFCSRI